AAGPNQTLETPMGVGGESLHTWMFKTRFWHDMVGKEGGDEGIDNTFAMEGDEGIGATIMGRNMFGPIRGEWGDSDWKGWWGEEPPYHHPVFVLTHHPHPPIEMQGGTIFNFVTDGIEAAFERAVEEAEGRDVRVGGGASVVQQYMRAGLLDEAHIVISPILLGGGERLFDNLGESLGRYRCTESVGSGAVTHVRIAKAD
ncbi:MAG: hypothetical protein QOH90_898, partial [Actinomycetota bacterium]|nr:hypothetical protein [Actinomycetota bacterium]